MTKSEATKTAQTVELPKGGKSDRKVYRSGGSWWISVTLPDFPNGMKNKTAVKVG